MGKSSGHHHRGRQAEHDAGHDGRTNRKGEHVRVDRQNRQTRNRCRSEQHERADQQHGQTDTGESTKHPQHEALGQQLRDHLAASRAERHADGDFAAARLGARQQETRDVRTRNQ